MTIRNEIDRLYVHMAGCQAQASSEIRLMREQLYAIQSQCSHENTTGTNRHGAKCPDCDLLTGPPKKPDDYVIVKEAPNLMIKNRGNSKALVTVNVGKTGNGPFAISEPLMRRYAERVGADFLVLDWPGHPDWPMSCKFAIPRALDYYDRIAYVDADVVLRDGCVNLFDMCAEDEFGALDELDLHRERPWLGVEAGYRKLRSEMGFEQRKDIPWYFNLGVMVVPWKFRHFIDAPYQPILVHQLSEQNHSNARLLDGNAKIRMLDKRCNWMHWIRGFDEAPDDAILHFAGMSGEARLSAMRQFA